MEKDIEEKETKKGKKIFKIVFIIIGILIAMFLVHAFKNYYIIRNLQNKILQYADSTNFYVKTVSDEHNEITLTMESYKKDNKQVVFITRDSNGEKVKMSIYDNGERINQYIETANTKILTQNIQTIMVGNIYSGLESENNWQTFLGSISSTVKSVKYNGKECYAIKGFMSLTSLSYENQIIYVEKDTGLLVKIEAKDLTLEREQSFNNVDNSIFIEPDASEYALKANN